MNIHPMLRDKRPIIPTRQIEALGDAIKLTIQDGHLGLQVQGRARDGKSRACMYLIEHPRWIENFAMLPKVTLERRTNLSDNGFYQIIQKKLGLMQPNRVSASQRIGQIADRIIAECMVRDCTSAIMFVDEAQWMSESDYEYLTNIGNNLDDAGFRLVCIFINQTDDSKARKKLRKSKELPEVYPPHLVGRYFMANHTFTGLQSSADIHHALDQYDRRLKYDDKTFTEYFAPQAFASGWRMSSHANDIVMAIKKVRKDAGFIGSGDLPMKVFDTMVYRLLVRTAAETANFESFDQKMIINAIAEPYIQLEQTRYRQAT